LGIDLTGVPCTAHNVAEDAAARAELIAKTGRMAVPVITVGDEVVVGFDRGRLKRLLEI
jgi:glutaredoxin 3